MDKSLSFSSKSKYGFNSYRILYCAYLPPGEGHNMRIKELIDKLLLLKKDINLCI